MNNILFYNNKTGTGAVGVVAGDSFQTTTEFDAGSFSTGWTHIERTGDNLLFYNQATGAAGFGSLEHGKFKTTETFPPRFFAPGWTHLTDTLHFTLFYRADTGEGAIVRLSPPPIQTTKSFPADGFSRGWTHIVVGASLILFFNRDNGSGAIAEPFDNRPPGGGGISVFNDIRTLKVFGAGSFREQWSQIVELDTSGTLLFYNKDTGAGEVSILKRDGISTVNAFPPGDFKKGWTHIVAAGGSQLFYNADDTSAGIGFDPTVREFPAGSFSTWTHLVSQVDPPVI